jgi:cystathionine beta-lyase
MKYDFSVMIDRRDTHSYKWDVGSDELPMWVADMDFPTAPEIVEAIQKRAQHSIFGYNMVPEEFFESISNWWLKRHQYKMETEWMLFCTGVVPAISSVVRKLTTVGENILIQSPVYNIFYNSIVNNGRHVLSSDLVFDGTEYHIDFKDMETKLANPQTTLMILCNPHNPIGKVWDKETLKTMGDLCYKHNVVVISDEIHCDLTSLDTKYTPFASVSKSCMMNSITCIAPTKAFNLAGLQTACIVVPNPVLRHKVNRGINTDEVAEPNSFACVATIAAFTRGERWLEELRAYIDENKKVAREYVKQNLPQLSIVASKATYLLWIDCSQVCDDSAVLANFIREHTGLYVSSGREYGTNGVTFIRINIACPRERLLDGLSRLYKGIQLFDAKDIHK